MVAAVSATPNPKLSSHQHPKRPPLVASEDVNDNGAPQRQKSREVSSRYLSSSSSTSTTTSSSGTSSSSFSSSSNSSSVSASRRRFPSPPVARTSLMTPMLNSVVKRSQSVERRRPATPRPGEMSNAAKMLVSSSRSLSVSFQGQSFALPISKAKPAPATPKPAPVTVVNGVRKGTPERRKAAATPARGQIENSKPIDQHRWPGRSRQVNNLSRSVDFTAERAKLGGSGSVIRALKKSMVDEKSSKPVSNAKLKPKSSNVELEKPNSQVNDAIYERESATAPDLIASDTESASSGNSTGLSQLRGGSRGIVVPARFLQQQRPGSPLSKNGGLKSAAALPKLIASKKFLNDSPASTPRGALATRGLSPIRGASRPASPGKLRTSSISSPSRGMPSPSGVAGMLNDTVTSTPSILTFAADVRRGKMGENRIVDAHLLRLLHNQHLQWRFVNARADASLNVQRVTAKKSLYNAWVSTSKLQHAVRSKRIELQLLRQNLKLYSILKEQMLYLDSWDLVDRDHTVSLLGAIEALEANTLRLPVVGGAKADVQNVKDAISSAVDVMQAMASSICSLLTKVELANSLVSAVGSISKNELALIDHCKDLLSTLTSMQVKECSLRIHVLQLHHVHASPLTTEV